MYPRKKGFTLIELLVVIAIIAILAVVVVLTLNPAELLKQSRDSTRLSDISTLTDAINLYMTDQSGASSFSPGNASATYLSVPDGTLSANQTSTCTSLNMSALPTGDIWTCGASKTNRTIGPTGWLPIPFSNMTAGSPISSLPVDPTNQTSSELFYSYNTNSNQFAVAASLESTKYKAQLLASPQDSSYPTIVIGGTPSSSIIYNPTGLVGWWPLTEGTSSTAYDKSNTGNNGGWSGTATGTNGYYSPGKIGAWAGAFDGYTTYVGTGVNNFPSGDSPISVFAWIYYVGGGDSTLNIVEGYGPYACPVSEFGLQSGQVIYDGSCGGGNFFGSGFYPPQNTWVFIGYTYTANASNTMYIYMNGSSASTNLATPPNNSLSAGNKIGSAPGMYDNYNFPGLVDDVRVYNRTLSPAEVQALYTSGN